MGLELRKDIWEPPMLQITEASSLTDYSATNIASDIG